MIKLGRNLAFLLGTAAFSMMTACGGGGGTSAPPVVNYTLTANSVSPASGVAITVSPTDNNSLGNGTTSFTRTYSSGSTVQLTAPEISGTNAFSAWTGCTSTTTTTCNLTLNANTTVTATYAPLKTPTVTVTPGASSITTMQALTVTTSVSGPGANPVAVTGTVVLTSGSYTSAATTLLSGSGTITVPAGSLAIGSETLTVTYTPDTNSSTVYTAATGTLPDVTVNDVQTAVLVKSIGDRGGRDRQTPRNEHGLRYDQSNPAIIPAFQTAGIKAIRWPGGSGSDDYHWANNTLCQGQARSLQSVRWQRRPFQRW